MSSSYKKNGAEGALGMVSTEFPVYLLCKFVSFLLLYYASAWLFCTSTVQLSASHNLCSYYCWGSGSGPPWLMGHFAFFCWMKGHKCKVSCYKGASIGHIYALKSSSGGMWWSSLKTCPIIKNCPKMAVFLFRMTHKFQMLLGKTGQL